MLRTGLRQNIYIYIYIYIIYIYISAARDCFEKCYYANQIRVFVILFLIKFFKAVAGRTKKSGAGRMLSAGRQLESPELEVCNVYSEALVVAGRGVRGHCASGRAPRPARGAPEAPPAVCAARERARAARPSGSIRPHPPPPLHLTRWERSGRAFN